MSKYDRDFLTKVTFKKELSRNEFSPSRSLLGLLCAANAIALLALNGALTSSDFAQFFLSLLFYSNGSLATYIAYEEMRKLEQRRYVAKSINWLMSRA